MKRYFYGIACFMLLALTGCNEEDSKDVMIFAICADYPPFEYVEKGEFIGFDVELAKMIAKELGKTASFKDLQFNGLLAAVQGGIVDAAISTLTITEERKERFDFSKPYYVESMAILFLKDEPVVNSSQLANKKVACQLGTTMEIWLKAHAHKTDIVALDNTLQAVESLKSGHVDGVLVDAIQAKAFVKRNPQLGYKVIAQADTGYGMAFKKGSVLKDQVDQALISLEKKGLIKKLKKKFLGGEDGGVFK